MGPARRLPMQYFSSLPRRTLLPDKLWRLMAGLACNSGVFFRCSGINYRLDFRDLVGRKISLAGVFSYHLLIGRDVDAVNLVIGYVAMDPLNLRAEFAEYSTGFLRDSLKLVWRQLSRAWKVAFDDVFGHRFCSPFLIL